MDIDVDHGASYGKTIFWDSAAQVSCYLRLADVQFDIDAEKFDKIHIYLIARPARIANPYITQRYEHSVNFRGSGHGQSGSLAD